MFYSKPKNLSTVLTQVPTDIYQLCTFDDFILDDQIKGIILVGNELIRLYPGVDLFISINPSPSGYVYASLDIPDEHLDDNPTIEIVVNTITPIAYDIVACKKVA